MVRNIQPRALLLALVLLLGAEVVVVYALGGSADVRSTAQLAVFPLLLLVFARLSFLGAKIPRGLLLCACLLGLSGAVLQREARVLEPGTFLLARFASDSLGGETKIIRDKIRSELGSEGRVPVSDIERTLQTHQDAQKLLDAKPKVAGVVWGTARWVTLTLRQSPPQPVAGLAKTSVGAQYLKKNRLKDLGVVTSLPSVGVSFADRPETVEFLSRLMAVWSVFAKAMFSVEDTTEIQRQIALQSGILAAWTSPEPRVFALWMLGSYYLGQGLVNSEFEPGMFACAQEALQQGYSKLRRGEARVLEAAIINNYVIAQLLGRDGVMPFNEAVVDAIKQLHRAYRLVVDPRKPVSPENVPAIAGVINDNIRYLKSSYGKQKRIAKSR
jgi:hypothetical protein